MARGLKLCLICAQQQERKRRLELCNQANLSSEECTNHSWSFYIHFWSWFKHTTQLRQPFRIDYSQVCLPQEIVILTIITTHQTRHSCCVCLFVFFKQNYPNTHTQSKSTSVCVCCQGDRERCEDEVNANRSEGLVYLLITDIDQHTRKEMRTRRQEMIMVMLMVMMMINRKR